MAFKMKDGKISCTTCREWEWLRDAEKFKKDHEHPENLTCPNCEASDNDLQQDEAGVAYTCNNCHEEFE